MVKKASNSFEPMFSRGEVAKVLNVTPLTIANRERNGKYPEPKRDLNNYRVYTLNDIFNLQILTFHSLDPRPVLSVMYDKGYRDHRELGKIIDEALSKRKGE